MILLMAFAFTLLAGISIGAWLAYWLTDWDAVDDSWMDDVDRTFEGR